jgi:SNF2 domain-containing protein/SNF2 helicase protein/helicase-like protein
MDSQLVVTPSGRLAIREARDNLFGVSSHNDGLTKVVRLFTDSITDGIFRLAATKLETMLPPELAYWQNLAQTYLTELCHIPETTGSKIDPIDLPSGNELEEILRAAPPMPGGEYLSTDTLKEVWRNLDDWVRDQVAHHQSGLAGFLQDRAPMWHSVGRVAFHLAENRGEPLFPFAFLATYIPGLSGGTRVRYQPLSKALEQYAGARNKRALVRLLSPVHQASEKSAFIRELVDSGDIFHPLAWTPAEAYRFLQESPLYEESGILVRLPDWWRKRSQPQVSVTIGQKRQKTLGANTLLDFDVKLALGAHTLTKKEREELLAADDQLVLLRGQWVEVDQEKLTAALDHWKEVEKASRDGTLSFIEGMRLLAGAPADLAMENGAVEEQRQWSFVRAGDWLGQVLTELGNPTVNSGTCHHSLRATLRPYQKRGAAWLRLLSQLGLGACLADDMGLGKTIQVLALLLQVKEKTIKQVQKPSLLVLPASLLANWKSEIARFAPSLVANFVHSSETDKKTIARLADDPTKSLRGIDVVLTTYGTLQRQQWLLDVDWRLAVLDEAQAIKNPAARQTRTVKKIKAEARIALTGTPVENRLSDLWSLFDFICPGLLGSASTFKKFIKTLDRREHDRYTPLRNLVQPYILRRMKTDRSIISDLPDKSEVRAYCGLSKRQAVLYEKTVAEMAESLDRMNGADGIKRRGLVLSYLMRFKQICNHPSQLTGDGRYQSSESGKFVRLAEICEEIALRQEKALVFTQFREMTQPLEEHLSKVFGQPGLVLHGATAVGRRKKLVDLFQSEEGPPFFVLSLKAGGTGLNLTAASHVIHFDRWWNPAVENQATDRAFRIGQKRNVLVHKFVCRGTIEERIDELIEEKKSLAKDLLEGGPEKLLTELSDRQLLDLVALDVNKAMAREI